MFQRQGKAAFKKDLTNIIALCTSLGDPQEKYKTIHIAGTNGKGSVSHIIASILQKNGYKTGLYTSPHYKDFRERIKINGHFISRQAVREFVNQIESQIKSIKPSFFEITVAMAFWYFAQQKCDYVVVETGLGGRLDSTNIINPLISVITNIGFDHQNMLGDTLPEIAAEKAGIIKSKTPVIIGEYQEGVESVFRKKAEEMKANLLYAKDVVSIAKKELANGDLSYHVEGGLLDQIKTDIQGPFTLRNLQTSLAALSVLNSLGIVKLDLIKSRDALSSIKALTNYIGRWHSLSKDNERPIIIADSAHNREGLEIAFDSLARLTYKQLHIVTGFVMEKDLETIVDLFPIDAKYYFAKADIPRGMNVDILKSSFSNHGRKGRTYTKVKGAYTAARRQASKEDLIFVVGSIFVVAEVL